VPKPKKPQQAAPQQFEDPYVTVHWKEGDRKHGYFLRHDGTIIKAEYLEPPDTEEYKHAAPQDKKQLLRHVPTDVGKAKQDADYLIREVVKFLRERRAKAGDAPADR
jgi:hypothetical protein